MDLGLTPSEQKFRDELRAWLKANLPAKSSQAVKTAESAAAYHAYLKAWQRKLFDGGYAGITWPKEFGGRGATFIEQAIFQEELALADAPERMGTIGQGLVGPTIIAVGTDAQKKRYLPAILSGDEVWCQGFSEPNAGSDLASLETKAVLDGDHFVVNGQKIWTSYAHIADLCMLVVRTDTAAPKHKGITCLLVDMKSSGHQRAAAEDDVGRLGLQRDVLLQPARAGASSVLGKVNEGWNVAITALSNERANLGIGLYVVFKRNLDAVVEQARKITPQRQAGDRRSRAAAEAGAGLRRPGSVSPQHHAGAEQSEQDRRAGPGRFDSKTLLERAESAQRANRDGSAGAIRGS